ncbi:MAG: cell division protein ZapA [Cypionkella sp.]
MAHVIVQVNGRPYTMQCPDGEEDHLKELANLLDTEVMRVKASVGIGRRYPPAGDGGPDGGGPPVGSDPAH